jgi:serine/threonine protein phosphatase PrpC
MGETIEWDSFSKVHRVRNLSLSRAIGDRYAKPAVSGQVEIKIFPVAEGDDEFFLLASDGLWDVMSSQDVVNYVHQRFDAELKRVPEMSKEDKENYKLVLRRNMARSVAREAYRRGSGDNICVLMVWLKDFSPSS